MIELRAFLICDSVSRDAQSGKWIITGVFDVVWAQAFPAIHPSMDFFFRLHFSGADAPQPGRERRMVLAFQSPSGLREQMPPLPVTVNQKGIADGVIKVQGFPLREPGDYEFELLVDGRGVARTSLTVERLPERSNATIH